MAQPGDPLADDPAFLKELLAGKDALIGRLTKEITRLRRWRFGSSAERVDESINPQLPLENILPSIRLMTDERSATQTPKQKADPRTRLEEPVTIHTARALPPGLPRQTVLHAPRSCQCPECGAHMRRLGEDISEMLDCVPGQFRVIRHVRPKSSCMQCSKIVQQLAAFETY